MSIWKQLNFIFTKKQKIELVLLWIIIIIGAFMELVGVSIIMPFVEVAMDSNVIQEKPYYKVFYDYFNMTNENQFLIMMAIAIAVIYVLKNAFLIFMTDMQNRFSFNNRGRLANRMMKGYLSRDYLFHSMKNISELYRNVTTDSEMLYALVGAVLQLFTELILSGILFIYLLVVGGWTTMALLILLGAFAGIYLKLTKNPTKRMGEIKRDVDAQMDKWVRQSFEGIKEVKILNREGFFIQNVDKYYKLLMRSLRKITLYNYVSKPIFEAGCVAIFMLIVGVQLVNGMDIKQFIPILTAFVVAAFKLLPSFSRLTTQINTIAYNKKSLDAVYNDLTDGEQGCDESLFDLHADIKKLPLKSEIEMKNLSFHYPASEENVIENGCLKVPVNESIALVGPSGAGKTTTADLILGILAPQSGDITVDGVSIYGKERQWQRNLGYIPQNIYLMDDTIRNNILFGVPEADVDEEALEVAIKKAQLKDFVDTLEEGINTYVGEHGVRLSGGQRQRIGIARALYSNPDVLVLDEATSALDSETETAVMEAINSLKGQITMVIVAHRLTTIRNCDHIYEVKDKHITEKSKESVLG